MVTYFTLLKLAVKTPDIFFMVLPVQVPFSHNESKESVNRGIDCLFRVNFTITKTASGMHNVCLYSMNANPTKRIEIQRAFVFFKLAGQLTKVN